MSDCRMLHLISGLSTGGAELALQKVLGASASLREGARVLSLRDRGTVGPRIAELGVPVDALGVRGSVPTPAATLRLWRYARAWRPKLVHGWMYHGNLAALAAARTLPVRPPVLWNVQHSIYTLSAEKPVTALVIRLGARLSSQARRIIYNSRTAAVQHERLGFDASRSVVVPNGFNVDRFTPSPGHRREIRERLGLGEEALLVGLFGRFHPMKDHANFLRAASRVADMIPQARFLLVGPGVTPDNPALQEQLAAPGLAGRVHLVGAVSDPERWMAAVDVLCSSSSSEGSPNVVGEAMATGVPCVVTDVGDSGWLVGDTGIVVPPRDPVALAEGLRRVLELDVDSRRRLGDGARARIQLEFTLARIAARYAELEAECQVAT